MARDHALLDLADRESIGLFRLYGWRPHCLSFGRHEPALRRYDRGRIEALGLEVVRRPTGGRAVWHARELTYALAAPANGSLGESYYAIHRLIAVALRALGLDATLAPALTTAAPLGRGACFTEAVGGEVLVNGRKAVGSAQLRLGRALLQHGSILIHDSQEMVHQVTRGSAQASGELPLASRLETPEDQASLMGRLVDSLTEAGACWTGGWRPLDHALAARLDARTEAHLPTFADSGWTWRR